MKYLLDKFGPVTTDFRPKRATDLFALRLAQKLDDRAAVNHYVSLADQYSEAQLLCAYRRTLRKNVNGDRGRRFHLELERVSSDTNGYPTAASSPYGVERRTVAAAIFNGEHLEYTDARQLSSTHDKALASAVGVPPPLLARFPWGPPPSNLSPRGEV